MVRLVKPLVGQKLNIFSGRTMSWFYLYRKAMLLPLHLPVNCWPGEQSTSQNTPLLVLLLLLLLLLRHSQGTPLPFQLLVYQMRWMGWLIWSTLTLIPTDHADSTQSLLWYGKLIFTCMKDFRAEKRSCSWSLILDPWSLIPCKTQDVS